MTTPAQQSEWTDFRPHEHIGMTEFLARQRREAPIFFDPALGYWIVTRRADARAIFFRSGHLFRGKCP